MNSKKILFLIDTCGPGGAEVVFLSIVKNIQAYEYTPIVILPDDGWLYEQLNGSGITVRIIPSSGSLNIKFLASLVKLIKAEKISLIHSHLFGTSLYGSVAALIANVPILSTIHGFVDLSKQVKFFPAKRFIILTIVRYMVFVSESLARQALPESSLNSSKKKVIHNGIVFGEKTKISTGNIRDRDIVIGCLGNIRPAKDYETMLAIAANMKQENRPIIFKIYGDKDKDYYSTLQSKLEKLNLNKIVYFEGFTSDIDAALETIDIFLLTSKSEGFSLATVEAMSRGLPVVASRSGGPEEIITHNHDGILVDVQDVSGFTAAIDALIDNPELRERLAEQASKSVKVKFSLEQMIEKYIGLYNSM